jgi:hypothetical protein
VCVSLRGGAVERADAVVATGDGAGGAFSGDGFGGEGGIGEEGGVIKEGRDLGGVGGLSVLGKEGGVGGVGVEGGGGGAPAEEGLLAWARGSGGWDLPAHAMTLRAPLPPLPTTFSFSVPSSSSSSSSSSSGIGGTIVDGDSAGDTAAASSSGAAQTSGNASAASPPLSASASRLELVYVGPLNLWGGLALFCDALDALLLHGGGAAENKEDESGLGAGIEGKIRRPPVPLAAVTFIGEDGPLAGFGGGVEGNAKRGSELTTERAKRWRRVAGVTVTVNPPPPPGSISNSNSVWGPAAYVIAGGGVRLAVLPAGNVPLVTVYSILPMLSPNTLSDHVYELNAARVRIIGKGNG